MKKGNTALGMEENKEALLTYILGWLTGIVFLVIEKENKFVRFHAMQSTVTFIGLAVLSFIVGLIPFFNVVLVPIVGVITVIVWIICMVKAYQGEKYKLPIVGNFSENLLQKAK
ncbi:MAG: DUF4870 domain-containing protein [Candidatus Aenigmarchaeota archaeon]|nr:DUF4870 domain-containing protein [Candidatus Aenigmarchaeota archaeon]